jgi:phage terminase small subunit
MMASKTTDKLWDLQSLQALKNDRQRHFVVEYLKDSCGAQAAIRAGYSPNCARQQAWDLLTRPDVRAALDVVRAQFAERLECTVESVLQQLVDVSTEAREAQQYSAAIRSLDLLGRHLGLFGNQHSTTAVSEPVEVERDEDDRSDAQQLVDFADDVRMMVNQRQKNGATVEEFIEDLEQLAGSESTAL